MIKLIIFDLDDTLISEKEFAKCALKDVSLKLIEDYPILNDSIYEEMLKCFNQGQKNIFDKILDDYNIIYTQKYIKELVDIYRNCKPKINFYDEVYENLIKLREQNILLGIITDGYKISQRNKLDAVDAHRFFDYIILTDELGKEFWKPNPRSFEMMKERFNVDYSEIMYVADNPKKDFYISKTYPIVTVRILREDSVYKDEVYYENVKEKYTIHTFDELEKLVTKEK